MSVQNKGISDGIPNDAQGELGSLGDGTLAEKLRLFENWCDERAESDNTHAYTRREAERRYARAKGVDREYQKRHEYFTTVWISVARSIDAGESLVEHAKHFLGRPLSRKLRQTLKQMDCYEEHAGVKMLAPHSLNSDTTDAPTHAHMALWLPSRQVSASDFHRLRETDGFDIHVRLESHDSDSVETPEEVLERGSGLDAKRGHTTRLPQELASNLPMLRCKYDARDTYDYITQWAANMRLGDDGQTDTRGVTRFQPLRNGRHSSLFKELANREKERLRIREGASVGRSLAREIAQNRS